MHRPPPFENWPLWKYFGGIVLGSLVVTGGFLWLGPLQTDGVTPQNAFIAGLLFIAITLGNFFVGVGYLKALRYTNSILKDEKLSK